MVTLSEQTHHEQRRDQAQARWTSCRHPCPPERNKRKRNLRTERTDRTACQPQHRRAGRVAAEGAFGFQLPGIRAEERNVSRSGTERKEHSVRAKKERPGRGSLANRGTRGRLDRTEASGRTSAETVEGSDEEAAGRTIRRRDRKKEGKKDYLDLDRAAVRRMPRRSVNGAGVGGNTMPPPGPRWGDQKVEGAWIRLYTIRPFLLALLLLPEYFSRVGNRDSVDLVVGQRKAQPPNYLSLSPVLHLQ
jgi:hypothetical protein